MAQTMKTNLNADMGEGFGAYRIGNDEELLSIVGSASIACGMHAGDPGVMYRVIEQAVANGVTVGAHPGFNDLWGFGRRRIDMAPRDLELLVAYQIGALQAMAAYFGTTVTHVKPHGALNNMAAEDIGYAGAIAKAMKVVDPRLIYVALAGSAMVTAAEEVGVPVAREGFIDRLYDDDGNLTSRKLPGAVIADPDAAAQRAVRMICEGIVITSSGNELPLPVDTLCIHGDEPTAPVVAATTRRALEAAGVQLVTLPEMVVSPLR
jgi:UPF0271 protein